MFELWLLRPEPITTMPIALIPRRPIALCLLLLAGFASPLAGQKATEWTFFGPGDWNDPLNWSQGVPEDSAMEGERARIGQGEAVLVETGEAERLLLGIRGKGALTVESGATLTVGRMDVGWSDPGTYVQNGGSVQAESFRLESPGSTMIVRGGTLTASDKSHLALGGERSTTLELRGGSVVVEGENNLVIARENESGILEIHGGTLEVGGHLAADGEPTARGEVRVVGSQAESIEIGADIVVHAVGMMHFTLDADGVTPITVGDDALLEGTSFEFETAADFSARVGDSFALLKARGNILFDIEPTVKSPDGYAFRVELANRSGYLVLQATVTETP